MSWLSRNLTRIGIEDWAKSEWESEVVCNSPKCSIYHAGGKLAVKELKLEGNGATTANLFTVSEAVRLIGIYGTVTAIGAGGVGTDDTLNDLKLELWDGTVAVDLTLANSDLTNNGTVGTVILKDAEDAVKMTVLEADAVKYHEGPTNKLFQEGIVVPKNGVTTYVRVSYTGDAATDITIKWVVRYAPKTITALITAV